MSGRKDWASAHFDHLSSLPGTWGDFFKELGRVVGSRNCGTVLRRVLKEEELILSTPCLVAQAQRQKWGAETVSERNRKLKPQYPAVWRYGLRTLEVTGSGWLLSVKA